MTKEQEKFLDMLDKAPDAFWDSFFRNGGDEAFLKDMFEIYAVRQVTGVVMAKAKGRPRER